MREITVVIPAHYETADGGEWYPRKGNFTGKTGYTRSREWIEENHGEMTWVEESTTPGLSF